jgi:O-antigen/teichoic acid export membrane protein
MRQGWQHHNHNEKNPYSNASLARNSADFLVGKVLSGLMTLVSLLWLVRLLPTTEFGVYVTLVASAEIGYAVASLGLPWVAARYIPVYRLRSTRPAFRHFVRRLLAYAVASHLGLAVVCASIVGLYTFAGARSEYLVVINLFLVILVVEGIGRFARESVLAPMMCQDAIRTSTVTRQLLFLVLLGFGWYTTSISLSAVVLYELIASLVSSAMAIGSFHIRSVALVTSTGPDPHWIPPSSKEMRHTARDMYLAHLATLTYSTQTYVIISSKFIGLEAAACFGFVRSLYEQIARYLPASLLFGVIRPKLVAVYESESGVQSTGRLANLAGKLSLVALAPALVFSLGAGEVLVRILSGDRFPDTGYFFFALMVVLIPFSQRQLLEGVAVIVGQSKMCRNAALAGVLTLPLCIVLIWMGSGLWAIVVCMFVGHAAFNVQLLAALRSFCGYQFDYAAAVKTLVSVMGAASLHLWWQTPARYWELVLMLVWAVVGTGALVALLQVFHATERNWIAALLRRE